MGAIRTATLSIGVLVICTLLLIAIFFDDEINWNRTVYWHRGGNNELTLEDRRVIDILKVSPSANISLIRNILYKEFKGCLPDSDLRSELEKLQLSAFSVRKVQKRNLAQELFGEKHASYYEVRSRLGDVISSRTGIGVECPEYVFVWEVVAPNWDLKQSDLKAGAYFSGWVSGLRWYGEYL